MDKFDVGGHRHLHWFSFTRHATGVRVAVSLSRKPLTELLQMSVNECTSLKSGLLDKFDESDDAMNTAACCCGRASGLALFSLYIYITRQAPTLDFHWGDTGSHRIAWTDNGILIDSSARKLVQLAHDVLSRVEKVKYTWRSTSVGQAWLRDIKREKRARRSDRFHVLHKVSRSLRLSFNFV